ncbi:50S ribosomal protein L29 [Candidatus Cloacimonas acidaminovorans]|jgi:large subunit ribosomal protein L29|uniref:Large ribosomal subunit protein uL29 n=1 Tax=Cloacimonas acidaminovorans (strain Evry) TaxID=459349 RepID=B0VI23_CLOAI|nr:50S ribosomal protein L29 [Candidatus Cloacimonas acidaminovorans]NLM89752.1 50S ribosomal protein L29 [Candidatus Cloacimonadota bacterium]CAO80994.1 ribosomal protein L29 [Candidatus Cloacimonas acidaminovorans str. Evry]HNZ89430.1 50S ribosomal protein L29 [Candidatus Cloacimonas acidaminovorans]HOI02412.1 50S ribosomal protein L29 [Candidatus Cloacimonas acidaminovorans]
MKIEEIRDLSIEELQAKLEELRIELFNLRFQKTKNLLDRPDRIRNIRHDIARIYTILTEREKEKKI